MLLLDGEWREEGSAELDVEFELRDLSNLAQRPTGQLRVKPHHVVSDNRGRRHLEKSKTLVGSLGKKRIQDVDHV